MGIFIFTILFTIFWVYVLFIIIRFLYRLLFKKTKKTKIPTEYVNEYSSAEEEGMRQAKMVLDRETYVAIRSYAFTGKLPEILPNGRWSNMYPNIKTFNIAGINFQSGIKALVDTVLECYLVEEPDNEFDENAIKVMHKDTKKQLGYVPADKTDWMRSITRQRFPYPCKAFIEKRIEYDDMLNKEKEFFIGKIIVEQAIDEDDDITPEMILNNPNLLKNPSR